MLSLQLFATRRGSARTAQVLNDLVTKTVLAGQAGFRTVWLAEHHVTRCNLCTEPLTLRAAPAANTTRIGLTGRCDGQPPLHHPGKVAVQAAVVNALSSGRLELGLGKGFASADYRRFGLEIARAD